jgi:phytoene desaturase
MSKSKQSVTGAVAVVGAGPGGLASAMLLAAAGVRVTLYEAAPVIGGRTSRISLRAGGAAVADDQRGAFHFDRGPTFFMMPYVLEEIFASAGFRLADFVELKRLDPMYRLVHGRPGREPIVLDTTQDIPEMARRLAQIEPADGPAFERFIRDNRKKLSLMEPILRSPMRSVLDLMNWDAIKAAPTINPHQSLYTHLSRYFRSDHVRLSMSFQSKYLGMSPYECPSLFSILPFIEYEYGIWNPVGGCNALTHAMAEACRRMGVEIVTSAPVTSIRFQGNRAVGVEVGGPRPGRHDHDHVVLNADAPWAIKNLIPAGLRRTHSDKAIDSKRYSCSTFMLYLGIEGEVDLPHHTISISRDYKTNIDDIAVRGTLSDDPSFYVCNPSRIDPSMAPRGCSALYVLVPTPNCVSGIDWAAQRAALRERTLAQLSGVLGLTDVERRIRAELVVTPDDWRGSNIHAGATFSLAHSLPQMLHRRPQHKLQDVEGVWLVGGGTHPGSGLPVIFLSSQITSRLLCEQLGVACPTPGRPATRRTPRASHAPALAG